MAGRPFITVRCPSCGSNDVEMDRPGHYRCDHCESLFLHQDAKQDTNKPVVASGPPPGAGGSSAILRGALLVGALGAGVAVYATMAASEPDPPPPPPEPVSSGHEIREANVERMKAAAAERDAQRAALAEAEPEPERSEPRNVDEILDPDLVTHEPEPSRRS